MAAIPAPVALFAFNRPEHTLRTLTALAANAEARTTSLHAFIDGPRDSTDAPLVRQVRDIVLSARGFGEVHVHTASENLGLYESITRGVGTMFSGHDAIIVLEDDIEVAPCFLAYMNDGLVRYRDTPKIGSIHAYAPPIEALPDYYFLRGGDCWGWATWADRWALFQRDPSRLLLQLRERGEMRDFMRTHGAQSLLQLLHRVRGRNQSWAIQWHASLFLAGRLTLHPGKSFVANIGFDGSGTHASAHAKYDSAKAVDYRGELPSLVEEDPGAALAMSGLLDRNAVGRLPVPSWALRTWAQLVACREAERIAGKALP